MATCALCVFSLLTGLGSWLCDSPAPTWWPYARGMWITSQLVVGAALIPAWKYLGTSTEDSAKPPQANSP